MGKEEFTSRVCYITIMTAELLTANSLARSHSPSLPIYHPQLGPYRSLQFQWHLCQPTFDHSEGVVLEYSSRFQGGKKLKLTYLTKLDIRCSKRMQNLQCIAICSAEDSLYITITPPARFAYTYMCVLFISLFLKTEKFLKDYNFFFFCGSWRCRNQISRDDGIKFFGHLRGLCDFAKCVMSILLLLDKIKILK